MSGTGETNLTALIQSMEPVLHAEIFVFCSLSADDRTALAVRPVGIFHEAEGMTLIVPQTVAIAQGWPHVYPCRQITLNVHSSLEAVGFLATVTQALAHQGISVNPVSAYYHDHLFVPMDQAEAAIACLHHLAATATSAASSEP